MAAHGQSDGVRPLNVIAALFGVALVLGALAILFWPTLSGDDQQAVGAMATAPPSSAAAASSAPAADDAPSSTATLPCTELRVLTATTFAPVLEALAPTLGTGDQCVDLVVSTADGRESVTSLAASNADVWIPDDASWASGAASGLVLAEAPGAGTVVATSPIYLLAGDTAAARLVAAGPTWAGLATEVGGTDPLALVTRDPAASGEGLVAVGAIGEAVWGASGMDAASGALSGARAVARSVTDPATAQLGAGDVALVTEQSLLAAGAVPTGETVLAPSDATAMLRFSWFPLSTGQDAAQTESARGRLLEALSGPAGVRALGDAGLRPADMAGPPASQDLPPATAEPSQALPRHHVEHVFAAWYPEDRVADLLLAIDISGSMFVRPPDSDRTLIREVKAGVLAVADQLPDDAQLGVWEFGASLDPPRDYRVVVAPAPLTATARTSLADSVGAINATETGTGLHDTILAAYLAAQAAHRPGVRSQVLVFTDGVNEADPGSLTLEELGEALEDNNDPERPVAVSVVVFGPPELAAGLAEEIDYVDGYVASVQSAQDVTNAFAHVAAGGLHG